MNLSRFSEYRNQDLDYVDFDEREDREAERGDQLRELEMEKDRPVDESGGSHAPSPDHGPVGL